MTGGDYNGLTQQALGGCCPPVHCIVMAKGALWSLKEAVVQVLSPQLAAAELFCTCTLTAQAPSFSVLSTDLSLRHLCPDHPLGN